MNGRRLQRRRRRGESGQSTLELGLALPVVVAFMLAVVQIGLVARDQLLVWHAARESARAAAVDPTPMAARRAAIGATAGLDTDRLAVTLGGATDTGGLATATVSYRSPTDVPVVGLLIGDVPLRAAVTVRVE